MRAGAIGIGVGFLSGGVGAGVSVPGAVLSNLAYAADLISVDTDTASGTIYYLLHNSVTPMAAADIKADVLDLSAVGGGTLDPLETDNQPVDWTAITPGSSWINMVQESAGGFSNVVSLAVTIVSGAFDPASVAGARLVWDMSDITTLWQSNTGTTQVTTTGQTVGSMTNLGSLGGLFTNSGGTDEPVYTESGGLKFLQFDGANDYLRWLGSSGDIPMSGGLYVIMGVEEVSDNDARGFISASDGFDSYNNPNGFMLDSFNAGALAVTAFAGPDNTNGIGMSDSSATTLARSVLELEITAATGSTNGWLRVRRSGDGDVVQMATDTANSGQFPDNSNDTTSRLVLGARIESGNPARFNNCRIFCGAVVTGTISPADRADYRLWAASKVGF